MSRLRGLLTAQRVVTLVIVAVVIAALTAILWEPSGDLEPGDTVPGVAVPEFGAEASNTVAHLGFGMVRMRTTVGEKANVGGDTVRTRGEERWVEVGWRPQTSWAVAHKAWPAATSAQRREPITQLILVAGGERYVLADHLRSSDSNGQVTMKVADASGLRLVLRSGGQDRPAEPDTRNAPRSEQSRERCQDDATAQLSSRVYCALTTRRSPYVAGLGWAPKGRDWLVVDEASAGSGSDLDPKDRVVAEWDDSTDPDADQVDYLAAGKPRLTLSVEGAAKPERTHGETSTQGVEARLPVRAYLIPAGKPAVVTLRYRLAAVLDPDEDDPGRAPARTTVDVHEVQTVDPRR